MDGAAPPDGLDAALRALWWDAKDDWAKAHGAAQEGKDARAERVHAYLHRKEGDPSNARYWYSRAGVEPATGALDAEWQALARAFLRPAS
ncbi:MAG: hypothetical protein FJX36_06065 [Alphaproteobacteria bacterium]|nr:hypothetical protein [Alphaproteobacteria bacterium]